MATALLRRQRPSIRLPSFFLAMACKRASTASYSPTGKILFVFNFHYSLSFLFHYTKYTGCQIWLVKYPYRKNYSIGAIFKFCSIIAP